MAVDKKDIDGLRASLPGGKRDLAEKAQTARIKANAATDAESAREWHTGKDNRVKALIWVGILAVLGIIVVSVLGKWH